MQLEVGRDYDVTVVKILPVGAVVELEDKSTELVHISNIANCYVRDVADFVSVGETYVATCEEGKNRPVQLTFLPLNLKSQAQPHRFAEKKPEYKNDDHLDRMIASADSSYSEKQRAHNKRTQRR